ncbi:hypothetical protein HYU13_01520 [Candidatus Woesearchaeota archaeon]|nr:hypothetical protein [Candidatus Woesearchaeota archaeon]
MATILVTSLMPMLSYGDIFDEAIKQHPGRKETTAGNGILNIETLSYWDLNWDWFLKRKCSRADLILLPLRHGSGVGVNIAVKEEAIVQMYPGNGIRNFAAIPFIRETIESHFRSKTHGGYPLPLSTKDGQYIFFSANGVRMPFTMPGEEFDNSFFPVIVKEKCGSGYIEKCDDQRTLESLFSQHHSSEYIVQEYIQPPSGCPSHFRVYLFCYLPPQHQIQAAALFYNPEPGSVASNLRRGSKGIPLIGATDETVTDATAAKVLDNYKIPRKEHCIPQELVDFIDGIGRDCSLGDLIGSQGLQMSGIDIIWGVSGSKSQKEVRKVSLHSPSSPDYYFLEPNLPGQVEVFGICFGDGKTSASAIGLKKFYDSLRYLRD